MSTDTKKSVRPGPKSGWQWYNPKSERWCHLTRLPNLTDEDAAIYAAHSCYGCASSEVRIETRAGVSRPSVWSTLIGVKPYSPSHDRPRPPRPHPADTAMADRKGRKSHREGEEAMTKAPWRKVIKYETNRHTFVEVLECGHVWVFGGRSYREAKKRRCQDCRFNRPPTRTIAP